MFVPFWVLVLIFVALFCFAHGEAPADTDDPARRRRAREHIAEQARQHGAIVAGEIAKAERRQARQLRALRVRQWLAVHLGGAAP